ncbi:TIGR04104 family putative zinc finger protein [Planococcus maritimus]|uniref:TIGR04104 family putative zinc finger protein n=1 Tax=Planococcus maritimus TaxID=192421 RepID=UPI0007919A99|nr:hypothetical protein AY633_03725 [Planococcus maritimus]OED33071.1 hypothetical protein BHE17_11645 [Planococcus maritimus]
MPRCQNCGFKWSWKEVIMLSVKGKKECSNCHKRQYISAGSSFWITFLITLGFVMPMTMLRPYYEIAWPFFILAFVIYMPLALSFAPFLYKLSNTKYASAKRSNN